MLEVRQIPEAIEPTLTQWYRRYQAGDIKLDPSYQRRGNLWVPWRKRLLINSILNGYDIPKIYLADFTYGPSPLKETNSLYAVIDGKQRLEAFFEFFEDKLILDEKPVHLNDEDLNLSGMRLSDLRKSYPELAARFERYVPTVMSVISDELKEIQELFIRLNTNLSVSGAERRNAMAGPIPLLIRDLSVHEFFRVCARFAVDRGQDLNMAARFLLLEVEGGLTTIKPSNLDRFVERNEGKSSEDFQGAYQQTDKALTKMVFIFRERDKLLGVQGLIPVFYWLVRRHGDDHVWMIRPFLQEFEEERAEVRRQLNARGRGEPVQVSDPGLVEFNNWLRTPDDRSRLEAMFRELEHRFFKYVEANPTLL